MSSCNSLKSLVIAKVKEWQLNNERVALTEPVLNDIKEQVYKEITEYVTRIPSNGKNSKQVIPKISIMPGAVVENAGKYYVVVGNRNMENKALAISTTGDKVELDTNTVNYVKTLPKNSEGFYSKKTNSVFSANGKKILTDPTVLPKKEPNLGRRVNVKTVEDIIGERSFLVQDKATGSQTLYEIHYDDKGDVSEVRSSVDGVEFTLSSINTIVDMLNDPTKFSLPYTTSKEQSDRASNFNPSIPPATARGNIHEVEKVDGLYKITDKITATKGQTEAIDAIDDWFNSESAPVSYLLSGSGGTGKTTVAKTALDKLKLLAEEVTFLTPTHKAKGVLKNSNKSSRYRRSRYTTVAKATGKIKDSASGQFNTTRDSKLKDISMETLGMIQLQHRLNGGLGRAVVIDESSMISAGDYKELLRYYSPEYTIMLKYVEEYKESGNKNWDDKTLNDIYDLVLKDKRAKNSRYLNMYNELVTAYKLNFDLNSVVYPAPRLLFMGDEKQLPPINDVSDNGSVLLESIVFTDHKDGINTSRLREVKRQNKDSQINKVTQYLTEVIEPIIDNRRESGDVIDNVTGATVIKNVVQDIINIAKSTTNENELTVVNSIDSKSVIDSIVRDIKNDGEMINTKVIGFNNAVHNNSLKLENAIREGVIGNNPLFVIGEYVSFTSFATTMKITDNITIADAKDYIHPNVVLRNGVTSNKEEKPVLDTSKYYLTVANNSVSVVSKLKPTKLGDDHVSTAGALDESYIESNDGDTGKIVAMVPLKDVIPKLIDRYTSNTHLDGGYVVTTGVFNGIGGKQFGVSVDGNEEIESTYGVTSLIPENRKQFILGKKAEGLYDSLHLVTIELDNGEFLQTIISNKKVHSVPDVPSTIKTNKDKTWIIPTNGFAEFKDYDVNRKNVPYYEGLSILLRNDKLRSKEKFVGWGKYTYTEDPTLKKEHAANRYKLTTELSGIDLNLKNFLGEINYAYVQNTYKAQGSSYKNVYVDLNSLVKQLLGNGKKENLANVETVLKSIYVAMSRPTAKLVIAADMDQIQETIDTYVALTKGEAPPPRKAKFSNADINDMYITQGYSENRTTSTNNLQRVVEDSSYYDQMADSMFGGNTLKKGNNGYVQADSSTPVTNYKEAMKCNKGSGS